MLYVLGNAVTHLLTIFVRSYIRAPGTFFLTSLSRSIFRDNVIEVLVVLIVKLVVIFLYIRSLNRIPSIVKTPFFLLFLLLWSICRILCVIGRPRSTVILLTSYNSLIPVKVCLHFSYRFISISLKLSLPLRTIGCIVFGASIKLLFLLFVVVWPLVSGLVSRHVGLVPDISW